MYASVTAPAQPLSRRRADEQQSTGLDYSTSIRVAEDIPSRIRTLLLSRHACRPPRTPWPSDEASARYQGVLDRVTGFDFTTARSVAEATRLESGTKSVPKNRIEKLGANSSIASSHKSITSISSRRSNSMNDNHFSENFLTTNYSATITDGGEICDTLLTVCPPCHPSEGKKSASTRRSLSIKPKKHIPSQYEFKTTSSVTLNLMSKVKETLASLPDVSSRDCRNPDGLLIDPHSLTECVLTNDPAHKSQLNGPDLCNASSLGHQGDGMSSRQTSNSSSSLVVGNLCLPLGPNGGPTRLTRRSSLPLCLTRAASSQPSLHPRIYSPSVENGAFRSSTIRHALLKPSVTDLQPVDLGLPIQPVLSKSTDLLLVGLCSQDDTIGTFGHAHGPLPAPAEILAKCLTIRSDSKITKDTNDAQPGFSSLDKSVDAPYSKLSCASNDNNYYDCQVFIPPVTSAIKSTVYDIASQTVSVNPLLASVEQDKAARARRGSILGSLLKADHPVDEQLKHHSRWEGHLSTNGPRVSNYHNHGGGEVVGRVAERQDMESTTSAKSPTEEQVAILPMDVVPTRKSCIDSILVRSDCICSPSSDGHKAKYCVNIAPKTIVIDVNLSDSAVSDEITPEAPPDQEQDPLYAKDDISEPRECNLNSFSLMDPLTRESTFTYNIVPLCKSSLDEKAPILGMKSGIIPARKHALKPFVTKVNEKLPLNSSRSSCTLDPPRLPQVELSDNSKRNSTSSKQSDSEVSVQRLCDVISRGEPDATRLNTLPQQAKLKLGGPLQLPGPIHSGSYLAVIPVERINAIGMQASENFTRAINDLENLLNEALYIARQAAEKNDKEYFPILLNDTADVSQKGSPSFGQEPTQIQDGKTGLRERIPHSRLLKRTHSRDSVHESARSILSNSSCNNSVISINDGRGFSQRALLKPGHFIADQTINIKSDLVAANSKNGAPGHGPQKETTKTKGFGKNAIGVISNALKTSSGAFKSRKVSSGGGENVVQICTSHLISQQYNEAPIERQIEVEKSESPSVPSRRSSIRPMSTMTNEAHMEDKQDMTEIGSSLSTMLSKQNMAEFVRIFHQPSIQTRDSSLAMRKIATKEHESAATASGIDEVLIPVITEVRESKPVPCSSSRCTSIGNFNDPENGSSTFQGFHNRAALIESKTLQRYELRDSNEIEENLPRRHISSHRINEKLHHLKYNRLSHLNLRGKSHVSIRGHADFSLSKSHKRQPIARDWSPGRKRFVASVACISTALVGVIIGIYAGEVPSIQYYIADLEHYAILGNVFFFIGIALTTFLFWPLPLLHGRKPYILTSMTIAMPLLFPQAVAVSMQRSPYIASWRIGLILPRAFMGCALGFANINFMGTLTDLFGASLMSGNPHQERVDEYDVRRHGGGLGIWLGIWTWCYMGSIGLGFFIGAWIINSLSPDWGFYVTIILIAAVLILNVLTPEVRRSAYRRSIAEVRTPSEISRRLARGEVMMHRLQTGPKWWGEEFHQGIMLSRDMMRQPGFLVMSFYVAWMYGQIVLTIVFLGSLMSKYYRFTSPFVGLTAMAIPFGALLAVPFQKASLFSRARHHPQRTDSMTLDRKITSSSHLIRRGIFTLVLPFAGLAYTLSSGGPPTPFILPVLFAGLIGFLSNLAIAECNGIIMETFDTSDLQPGMTGRPRGISGERTRHKRTNYSSFPRISSAFAITQALGFLIAAAATRVGGVAERHLGAMSATGVMAGILLVLTLLFLGILIRWKEVQIIPSHRAEDIEIWEQQRQENVKKQEEAVARGNPVQTQPGDEERWRPVIIGNPSGKFRRMSILELGSLSRWSEIRRKNRLVDEMSYEAQHPNLATLDDVRKELRERKLGSLRRQGRKRSKRSLLSQENSVQQEAEKQDNGDLGERRMVNSQ